MHPLEAQIDADCEPGAADANQRAVVSQPPPIPPQPREDATQAVELPTTAEAQVGAHRNAAHRPRTGSRQPSCSGVAATSVSARSVSATIGVRSAGCAATSGGTATVFSPGASRPRPPAVPTQTLSRTATRLRTGVSLQTLTTDPSSLTTNSPRTLPTHTPSGAGASAAAPSSAKSLILEPGASTRTTPRSHASQSDRPRAISRLPSTQGNPSVPVPSIVVSADRSRATHVHPRRSPTRPADATHTPPGAAATAPARVAISPNLSGFHSPVAGSTRTRPAPSEPKNSSLRSGERAAAVKR